LLKELAILKLEWIKGILSREQQAFNNIFKTTFQTYIGAMIRPLNHTAFSSPFSSPNTPDLENQGLISIQPREFIQSKLASSVPTRYLVTFPSSVTDLKVDESLTKVPQET
jgi:hypothetical protein